MAVISDGTRVPGLDEIASEDVLKLEVEDFPVTVINDIYGDDLYQEGKVGFRIPINYEYKVLAS